MVLFLEGNVFEFNKMNVEQRMCGRTGKSPFARDPSPEVVVPSTAEGQSHGRGGTTSSLVYKNRAQCTSGKVGMGLITKEVLLKSRLSVSRTCPEH